MSRIEELQQKFPGITSGEIRALFIVKYNACHAEMTHQSIGTRLGMYHTWLLSMTRQEIEAEIDSVRHMFRLPLESIDTPCIGDLA